MSSRLPGHDQPVQSVRRLPGGASARPRAPRRTKHIHHPRGHSPRLQGLEGHVLLRGPAAGPRDRRIAGGRTAQRVPPVLHRQVDPGGRADRFKRRLENAGNRSRPCWTHPDLRSTSVATLKPGRYPDVTARLTGRSGTSRPISVPSTPAPHRRPPGHRRRSHPHGRPCAKMLAA